MEKLIEKYSEEVKSLELKIRKMIQSHYIEEDMLNSYRIKKRLLNRIIKEIKISYYSSICSLMCEIVPGILTNDGCLSKVDSKIFYFTTSKRDYANKKIKDALGESKEK